MKKIAVVAPTFNEAESIQEFIKAVLAVKITGLQLVISDSQSRDQTQSLVRKFKDRRVHFLRSKIPGPGKLGVGLTEGLDFAVNVLKADYLVTLEADLTEDPNQIPDFVAKLAKFDLVIGSRYAQGGKIQNWSFWRKFLSRLANFLLMLLVGNWQIHEYTNLYRAFRSETWKKIRPKVSAHTNWLFVSAFVFESLAEDLKITELPITYFDRFGGKSKMNTVGYSRDLMFEAIKYRLEKSASFLKFCVVGGIGFLINTAGLIVGVHFGLTPANAGAAGAEFAIVSNFILNNFWTFSDRQLTSWKQVPGKFIQFNVLSLGSLIIQYASLKIGELIFGLTKYKSAMIDLPLIKFFTWYMLFYVAGVGLGLIWNYFMYSRVIWAKKSKATK